jgi:hypothetical protein
MLYVILYFKLRNFVISQFGIRNIVMVIFIKIKTRLRVDFSKNLLSWNLGGQQIVPRPFFSDSPYKNRVVANFSAQTDTSWRKFWGRKVDDAKNGQKKSQTLFSIKPPNHVRLS